MDKIFYQTPLVLNSPDFIIELDMGTHALILISPAKELVITIKDSFNFFYAGFTTSRINAL